MAGYKLENTYSTRNFTVNIWRSFMVCFFGILERKMIINNKKQHFNVLEKQLSTSQPGYKHVFGTKASNFNYTN